MQAKKCDRCGAFYTENKTHCYAGGTRTVVCGVAKITPNYTYGMPITASQIDLCDNCIQEFDDWVKVGATTRQINEKE